METFVRIVALILGIFVIVSTALSVFTGLVVPRVTSSRAMRSVSRIIGGSARKIMPHLPAYESRDRLMSFVGPLAMVMLFVLWLGLLVFGFGLITWWASGEDFGASMAISGSSVFTLGIASSRDPGSQTLEIVAAAVGLLVVALEIAYLPALYNAFATRETEVTLLASRSGTPAWGPEILARHHALQNIDELPPLYADWERWAAAVSESHANYPALIWFRSPVSSRGWLLSLVAMMDSAALYHAVSPTETPRQARLCLSMGTTCLRSMARALHIPHETDPLPTAGLRLTKDEFADGYRRLEEVSFPMERDLNDAWRHFQGWRVNYESIVDELTKLVMPPPAPWFISRPELGVTEWPGIKNRTPDDPEGAQPFGSSNTFKTPSLRPSKSS
ncbi:MAG TPA: hypothetical protein VHV57_14620 [Acidimicrobiales bacterium]|nr:hypothetical protein [Acidimicrobiales bacterium]